MKNTKSLSCLCLILSIMGILMLFVPVLEYAYSSYYGYKMYYNSASGFSLLLFNAKGMTSGEIALLGILSWGQLIIGISMLVLSINLLRKKDVSVKRYITVITFIGVSAFLYMLEGIVATLISSSKGSYAMTYAEIPFFIILVVEIIAIVYLDSYKKHEKQMSVMSTNSVNTNTTTTFQQREQEDDSIFIVDGEVKLLKIYKDYVMIETKVNARAILTHNVFGGNKKIFYQNMIGVQFKESSTFILGYIQFETANTSSKDNFNSENSVTFSHLKVSNEYVKQAVDFVEKKIISLKNPTNMSNISSADELLKFKNLLDSGIISQEEFEKKKKELI